MMPTRLRRPLCPFLAALLLCLLAAIPARAQDPGDAELQALKYYVSQSNERSARAELRRLRARYPEWEPPADLTELTAAKPQSDGPGDDAERIWHLIEIGNLHAARGRLDHLRNVYPEWEPPADMIRLIELGEAQTAFDRAVSQGRAAEAIRVARKTPDILRCNRVNNAWQLAALQRSAGKPADALLTYRGVIGSCSGTSILVATLQKADSVASVQELKALVAFARKRHPDAAESFEATQEQLLAGRGVKSGDKPARKTQAQPQRRQPPERSAAAPVAPSGPVASGALPTKGDGRISKVRAAAKAGAWSRCIAASTSPRSMDVLYERAWCAYNLDRSLEALALFRIASRADLGARVNRDARFGMILAYLGNQMTEDAARLAAVTDLTHEQRVQVEGVILDQRGVRAFQLERFREAINYFDAMEKVTGSIRRDLAILRAYAYLNSGQRVVARHEFQRLHDQLATAETRRGLRAALD